MALYKPTPGQADPTAFGNSMAALDQAFEQAFGNGVITGLALSSNGNVSAGSALVGHVISIAATVNVLALFQARGSTGTFDLWATAPAYLENPDNTGVVGTYPDTTGKDTITFVVVPTGAGIGSTPGAMVATATLAANAITVVNNAPAGRVNLLTLSNVAGQFAKLQTKQAFLPLNPLTAPLPTPLYFVFPYAATLTQINLRVMTAPVGNKILTNCLKNGSLAVWATGASQPQIAAGANTGSGLIGPDGANSFAANDYLSIDLSQVGSATPGGLLIITVVYLLQ